MNGRIVLLQPYVPEGVQIVIEGPTDQIRFMADAALAAASVFWAVRLAGQEGTAPRPSKPTLVQ